MTTYYPDEPHHTELHRAMLVASDTYSVTKYYDTQFFVQDDLAKVREAA